MWIKSSYSADTSNCVERFRKSSYSSGGDCVDVGECWCHGVPIRDSKNPDGPVLMFTEGAWAEFLAEVKHGQFDI